MKNNGTLFCKKEGSDRAFHKTIPLGHYNLVTLMEKLEKAFPGFPLTVSTDTTSHALVIKKHKDMDGFWVDEPLAEVIRTTPKTIGLSIFTSRVNFPNSYTSIVTLLAKITTCIMVNQVIFWLASKSLETRKKELLILRIFKITHATQSLFNLQTALPGPLKMKMLTLLTFWVLCCILN